MSRTLHPHQVSGVDVLRQAFGRGLREVTVSGCRYRLVPGLPRYMVSDAGHVFSSIRGGRLLRPTVSPQGYPYVSLMGDEGQAKKFLVHRLVAEAFIANPFGLACVNHRNGVKTDLRVSNLEWATYAENNNHARATKLSPAIGETHYAAKLSDAAVAEIRSLGTTGLLHREIAAQYGVRRQHITKILNNQVRVGGVQ